jgi:hypothetical protein
MRGTDTVYSGMAIPARVCQLALGWTDAGAAEDAQAFCPPSRWAAVVIGDDAVQWLQVPASGWMDVGDGRG